MLTNVHDYVGNKSFLIRHQKICAFAGMRYKILGKERIVMLSSNFDMWLQVTKTRVLFCGTLTYHS